MERKRSYKKIVLFLFCITLGLFQCGCGMVSVMGTPTRYEEEVPAEYNLADLQDKKILVFVKQPYWLDAEVNLRVYLTDAIHEQLIKKAGISPGSLIGYDKLSKYRTGRPSFSLMNPSDVGKALGADIVLFVNVIEAKLENMPDTDIYTGSLSAQAFVIDTSTGVNLWPEQSSGRSISVGFEMEEKGLKAAVSRLSGSTSHCIVRYLYNCKVAYFKIRDDKSDPDLAHWD
ncbi:MAG: hypothetical protein ACYSRQ_03415 [Planctomycetota bacterium]|jgi:hypothetical protein